MMLRMLAFFLLVSPPIASGQTRVVFSYGPEFRSPAATLNYEVETARTLWQRPGRRSDLVATSDGRYIVTFGLQLIDQTTGVTTVFAAGADGFGNPLPHPRAPVVYGWQARNVVVVEGGQLRPFLNCTLLGDHQLSLDGTRWVGMCDENSMAVVDTATKRVVGRAAVPSTSAFSVNATASRVVAVRLGVLEQYDLATGRLRRTATSPVSGFNFSAVIGHSADRRQVFVRAVGPQPRPPCPGCNADDRTLQLNAETLELVRVLPIRRAAKVLTTPDGRLAFASLWGTLPSPQTIVALDLSSNRVLAQQTFNSGLDFVVVTSPLAPILTNNSSNDTVQLTWALRAHSPAAIEYIVEAGSDAGLSDIAIMRMTAAELQVANVPAGTYYVRVRAVNAVGTSVPSNEVIVTVAGGR